MPCQGRTIDAAPGAAENKHSAEPMEWLQGGCHEKYEKNLYDFMYCFFAQDYCFLSRRKIIKGKFQTRSCGSMLWPTAIPWRDQELKLLVRDRIAEFFTGTVCLCAGTKKATAKLP